MEEKKNNTEMSLMKKITLPIVKAFIIIVIVIFTTMYIPSMLFSDLTIICVLSWTLILGVILLIGFIFASIVKDVRKIFINL